MRKTVIIIVLAAFIAGTSFATNNEQQVRYFFKLYAPYENTRDRIGFICGIYAKTMFELSGYDDLYLSKLEDGNQYIISWESVVGKPREDVADFAPLKTREEIRKVRGKLQLEWLVDMDTQSIKPRNFFAKDCLRVYEEMTSAFGPEPQKKEAGKKHRSAWKFD